MRITFSLNGKVKWFPHCNSSPILSHIMGKQSDVHTSPEHVPTLTIVLKD